MKITSSITALMCILTFFLGSLTGADLQENPSQERIGVSFDKLKIYHQHAWRNLSVNVSLSTMPEYDQSTLSIQEVREYIRNFLRSYSNEDDFWEVMNVKLVKGINERFPLINNLESTLSLCPDEALSYPRSSRVEYARDSEVLIESFSFTKLNYAICQETFRSLNFQVNFFLKANPSPEDYPDYQWVDEAMKEFFAMHPVGLSAWSAIKPLLEEHILNRFPSLTKVEITIKNAN